MLKEDISVFGKAMTRTCIVVKSVKVEERKLRFLEGTEKRRVLEKYELKRLRERAFILHERDFVGWCHLSSFHWFLGWDISTYLGKFSFWFFVGWILCDWHMANVTLWVPFVFCILYIFYVHFNNWYNN